jgi:hypothetical protein
MEVELHSLAGGAENSSGMTALRLRRAAFRN